MKLLAFIFTVLISSICISQNNEMCDAPFIDVIGTAEQEVVPDMIYIEITLSEKVVNRKNYTIVEQENNLRAQLKALNISLDQLSLSDSNTYILRNRRRETGVKITKEFMLLVHTSDEVSNVFRALNEINIKEASIAKTEHSKITEIRKEVRKEAIRAAKEKAGYLLEAIDEELGKPIEVREHNTNSSYSNGFVAQSNINRPNASFASLELDSGQVMFQSFKVKFSYYIKYAIKQ